MKNALWVTIALTTVALAGCTEELPPEPIVCVDPGHSVLTYEEINQTTGEKEFVDYCLNVASASLSDLPATSTAYTPISLTWTMHTDLEESHSHKNGIRISEVSNPSHQGRADDYGTAPLGATEEHRNFVEGDFSTVTWTPQTAGTYYVRAYAVSAADISYWGPEQTITVSEVAPTGTTETVTLFGGGLPQLTSVDPDPLELVLGDAVEWVSSDPGVTWTVYRSKGPDNVAAWTPYVVGSSEAVLFQAPGQYRYTAIAERPDGEELGRSEGHIINVTFPE